MESLTEKEFEEKLFNYLRRNNRTHFTTQSLTNRLKEIVADPELIEYGRKNAQNILNKMEEEGKIYVEEIAKKIYYSVDFPESGYQKTQIWKGVNCYIWGRNHSSYYWSYCGGDCRGNLME